MENKLCSHKIKLQKGLVTTEVISFLPNMAKGYFTLYDD
jgi:hypothetical protein